MSSVTSNQTGSSLSEKKLFGSKSKISHAILHENPTQDRRLEGVIGQISLAERRRETMCDQLSRAFVSTQLQKGRQWKREDENRISQMNLAATTQSSSNKQRQSFGGYGFTNPPLTSDEKHNHRRNTNFTNTTNGQFDKSLNFSLNLSDARMSMGLGYLSENVLYRAPHYNLVTHSFTIKGPVIPVKEAVDESTAIILRGQQVLVRRVQRHLRIKKSDLEKHNTYCGNQLFNDKGSTALKDSRFQNLKEILAPTPRNVFKLRPNDYKSPRVPVPVEVTEELSLESPEQLDETDCVIIEEQQEEINEQIKENLSPESLKSIQTTTLPVLHISTVPESSKEKEIPKYVPELKKTMSLQLPAVSANKNNLTANDS